MGMFIKTVTKEVVDVGKISDALRAARNLSRGDSSLRLVMSERTKQAIKSEFVPFGPMSTVVSFKCSDLFEGCPVDTNNALEFGEVLFTKSL